MAKVLWVQKQDVGPRVRGGHAMAFDAARHRVVLFGGVSVSNMLLGDTWTWDGENWTQVQDIGPSARCFHAVAYDSVRGRVALFGGESATGTLNDTWEWDGSDWMQVADSGPSGRSRQSMAFDAARQRVVLFGGRISAGGALNDTQEWDGNDWVQQQDTGPLARSFAAMSYDSTRNRVVLFGGVGAASSPTFGDTWEQDGTAWTEEANFGPDPCLGATMVFNGASVALYGGIQSLATTPPPKLFALSWEWDGKHWTARQDMGPGPRAFQGAAFDSARSRLVLFGGASAVLSPPPPVVSIFGDTWEQFGTAPATGGQPGLVVFHIPAGTGSSAWNTLATIVVAAVGDTLRIVNDDSVAHMPHTGGPPFPHPVTDVQPGQQADYLLQSPFDPGTSNPLYDHDHGSMAQFWIRVHA